VVAVGLSLQLRLLKSTGSAIATAPAQAAVAPAPSSPATVLRPAEDRIDRVTSVEDLPRAARIRPVAMPVVPARPLHLAPSASASAAAGAPAAEGSSDTAAASASAAPEEIEVPSVAPPPADPLIQAVKQSIDDGQGK
jgi:hypothetical protein